MREVEFSEEFIKMLKHLNKNIKNYNGIDCYLIPVQTINKLKRLFEESDNTGNADDEDFADIDYEQFISKAFSNY